MAEVTSSQVRTPDIRRVPQDEAVRSAVRELATACVVGLDQSRPPSRADLEERGTQVLERLSLPREYLGFTMVSVSNAFWRPQFEAVPFSRRLLFLPCCLRNQDACKGEFDSIGLNCVGCSECVVNDLKTTGDELGYQVLIAEGTPAVVAQLMECDADAIVGVACLESLEQAFNRIVDVGVPYIAVPLLKDGCTDTVAETDRVLTFLRAERRASAVRSRSYAPLLRESARIFAPESLARLLGSVLPGPEGRSDTDAIAIDWLGCAGKRFRPFVTLAAYAVSEHGASVLAADADAGSLIPDSVRKIAVAIEVLHKASLVHDDIEDADAFRYGRETLHKTYGTAPAINVGDYLIGLGYRLISGQAETLGAGCVADILAHISAAHLQLCRGQGDELLWQHEGNTIIKPIDALSIYARKTAPAFEAALYAGLRAAGADIDEPTLGKFAVYLGEAYQVLNDLDDWRDSRHNKVVSGLDVLAQRPTLLRAFAIETGAGEELAAAGNNIEKIRTLYEKLGVFDKAEQLVGKLRGRATDLAGDIEDPGLRDLLLFIVRIVL